MSDVTFPFVLDGFPRTGSTTLTRILGTHPEIRCCMEPFHPKRFGGEFHRVAETRGMAEALALISLRWNGLKHVWEPGSAWPFSGKQYLNDALVRNTRIVVSLRRRNLLQQYVSSHISKHLGFWVGRSSDFYNRLDCAYVPPIPVPQAVAAIEQARSALQQRDALLRSISSKQLVLYYEDIFESNMELPALAEFCNWFFEELGYQRRPEGVLIQECYGFFDPREYKWANPQIYDRIPGSRLLDEMVGSDVNGYLFPT